MSKPISYSSRNTARRFHIFTAAMCFGEAFFAAEFAVVPYLASVPSRRWWVITANATFFSVLGGLVFFGMGWWFASAFSGVMYGTYEVGTTPDFLDTDLWTAWFNSQGWVLKPWMIASFVTFIAALLPLPYKLYGLAAGLSGFGFINFMLASIFGKIVRHGVIFFAACKSFGWLARWIHGRSKGPPKWLSWIKP